jgi:hypothetical protein
MSNDLLPTLPADTTNPAAVLALVGMDLPVKGGGHAAAPLRVTLGLTKGGCLFAAPCGLHQPALIGVSHALHIPRVPSVCLPSFHPSLLHSPILPSSLPAAPPPLQPAFLLPPGVAAWRLCGPLLCLCWRNGALARHDVTRCALAACCILDHAMASCDVM